MTEVIEIFSKKVRENSSKLIVIKHIHKRSYNPQYIRYMSKFKNLFKPKTYENLSPFKRGCNALYYNPSANRDVQLH